MSETLRYILIVAGSVLTSVGLWNLIEFLIRRKDIKKKENDLVLKELKKLQDEIQILKRDGIRTQLIFLINTYPSNKTEILKVAYHYFVELKGDWVATDIFANWCRSNEVDMPSWFDSSN